MRLFRLQLYLYLRLRSRQTLRVMSGVGIVRCVVIVVLAMALLVVVAKADRPWVAPVVSAVLLLFYNNERRDRRFLAVNFKYAKALMACEYVLACLPFIVAEVLADRGLGACAIVLVSAVVPFFRVVKIGACVIPLPFFYKGGVEYFRLFRRYGFLYLLMLSAAVNGVEHCPVCGCCLGSATLLPCALSGFCVLSQASCMPSIQQCRAGFRAIAGNSHYGRRSSWRNCVLFVSRSWWHVVLL